MGDAKKNDAVIAILAQRFGGSDPAGFERKLRELVNGIAKPGEKFYLRSGAYFSQVVQMDCRIEDILFKHAVTFTFSGEHCIETWSAGNKKEKKNVNWRPIRYLQFSIFSLDNGRFTVRVHEPSGGPPLFLSSSDVRHADASSFIDALAAVFKAAYDKKNSNDEAFVEMDAARRVQGLPSSEEKPAEGTMKTGMSTGGPAEKETLPGKGDNKIFRSPWFGGAADSYKKNDSPEDSSRGRGVRGEKARSILVKKLRLGVECPKDNRLMTFSESLERLKEAGYTGHLFPYEAFWIIMRGLEEGGELGELARDMLQGYGEWLNVECKREGSALQVHDISRPQQETRKYDLGSSGDFFHITALEEENPDLVIRLWGVKAEDVLTTAQMAGMDTAYVGLYVFGDGKWRPVARGYGDYYFILDADYIRGASRGVRRE